MSFPRKRESRWQRGAAPLLWFPASLARPVSLHGLCRHIENPPIWPACLCLIWHRQGASIAPPIIGGPLEGNYQSIIKDLVDSYGKWFQDKKRLEDGRMTDLLYPYHHLFSPIQVNCIKIKNRIVMGPMGNVGAAEETGRPSNKMIQYFRERAKGGAGLITPGGGLVGSPECLVKKWRLPPMPGRC